MSSRLGKESVPVLEIFGDQIDGLRARSLQLIGALRLYRLWQGAASSARVFFHGGDWVLGTLNRMIAFASS